jgi:tetratricopeptide (TPR) repeat protein
MDLVEKFRHSMFVFCFIILGGVGLVFAFKFGSASLSFYHVKNILFEWQTEGDKQSETQYLVAKSAIQHALSNHPSNPLYVDIMGQIYEWGTIAEYENEQFGLEQAKLYYLKATQMRPSWPVTWASLAMIKWRSQEFDEKLLFYLEQANRFGPLKPEVHVIYSELGLALYSNNHPLLLKIRKEVHKHLALGLKNINSRQIVIDAITQNELQKQVCRWLRDEPTSILKLLEGCLKRIQSS